MRAKITIPVMPGNALKSSKRMKLYLLKWNAFFRSRKPYRTEILEDEGTVVWYFDCQKWWIDKVYNKLFLVDTILNTVMDKGASVLTDEDEKKLREKQARPLEIEWL